MRAAGGGGLPCGLARSLMTIVSVFGGVRL